jgi:hypothetical protein
LIDSRQQSFADKLAQTKVVSKKDLQNPIGFPTRLDNRIWRTGKIIVYVSIALLICLNIVLQYEQSLLPGAEEALINYAPEDTPIDNGFYALSAFGIPKGENAFETGFQRTIDINKSLLQMLEKKKANPSSLIHSTQDTLSSELNNFQPDENETYIQFIERNKDKIKKYWQEYGYLQNRYQRIRNKVLPDLMSPVPIMLPLVTYHRLYCANFALEYISGNKEYAIQLMQKSDQVCLNMLEKTDSLIFKLVSVILTHIHQNAIFGLLSYEDNLDPALYHYIMQKKDFSKEALSFRKAFMQEYNLAVSFLVRFIDSPEAVKDYYISKQDIAKANPPLIKANDMVNHAFIHHTNMSEFSELPSFEMSVRYDQVKPIKIKPASIFYNPIGVILEHTFGSVVYTNYAVNARDLQIKTDLLKASAMIKYNHIKDADVAEYLKFIADDYYNKYTNLPFIWDEQTREICFDGPAQDEYAKRRRMKL